jgi:hypothetical protein
LSVTCDRSVVFVLYWETFFLIKITACMPLKTLEICMCVNIMKTRNVRWRFIVALWNIIWQRNVTWQWIHSGKRLRMCEIVCWWRKCGMCKNRTVEEQKHWRIQHENTGVKLMFVTGVTYIPTFLLFNSYRNLQLRTSL